jgi:hypothetical protein
MEILNSDAHFVKLLVNQNASTNRPVAYLAVFLGWCLDYYHSVSQVVRTGISTVGSVRDRSDSRSLHLAVEQLELIYIKITIGMEDIKKQPTLKSSMRKGDMVSNVIYC